MWRYILTWLMWEECGIRKQMQFWEEPTIRGSHFPTELALVKTSVYHPPPRSLSTPLSKAVSMSGSRRRGRAPYDSWQNSKHPPLWTSLPSPSVILRRHHVLPPSAKSGAGDHFFSEGMSNKNLGVLSVAKMWDKGQQPDGRGKTGSGLGAACPHADPHERIQAFPMGRPDVRR